MSLANQLRDGLALLGLDLSAAIQSRLLDFVALLRKWNRTYNLTAIRDEGEMVTQHLLDSLSVLPALPQSCAGISPGTATADWRWADVGSGAGLPGIPLAIARPDLAMTLIEAVDKKSAFQRQAKIELGLSNVTVFNGRVEAMPGGRFDVVISRAFADLTDFVRVAGHLAAPYGRLYAMKGLASKDEARCLPSGWVMLDCARLSVPGLDAQRHLIVLERL
ncbi:MAG: 16S rRNA (guanine(527)-N(7))-methyltransferase RsmG [Sulfuritalea sp.]|nr:16S rRNA (guanine(527)-N(7))-methyltransferase RsmG [Sulfuritalea sp.]